MGTDTWRFVTSLLPHWIPLPEQAKNFHWRFGAVAQRPAPAKGRGQSKGTLPYPRDHVFDVALEKGEPGRGRSFWFRSVFANGRIGDMNVELGQFGLDAATAPGGIGLPHPTDEVDELTINWRAALYGSGFPTPEQTKTPVRG